ncbi:MAG TPA: flagellar motor protein MotB [Bacillales bacterium]|nr:flagellar motor protein MotB [Bacillales bacterium]
MNRRRKRHAQEGDRDRWLITYSDMITLLLIFFIVLYSMSQVQQTKFNALIKSLQDAFEVKTTQSAPSNKIGIDVPHLNVPSVKKPKPKTNEDTQELDELYAKLQNYIKEHHLSTQMALVDLPRGVQITFRDSILFDLGSDQLKPQAFPVLHDVGGLINTVDSPVSVEGYTDDIPISQPSRFRSNWELSTARALSVRQYLDDHTQIASSRFRVTGYGKYHPVAPNDTPAHRAENRRVNIVVLRQGNQTKESSQ